MIRKDINDIKSWLRYQCKLMGLVAVYAPKKVAVPAKESPEHAVL
jgi:hypothetical protein